MQHEQANIIPFRGREQDYFNQELESIEVEIAQVRVFLGLSDRQRSMALVRVEDTRQSLLSAVRSLSQIYQKL